MTQDVPGGPFSGTLSRSAGTGIRRFSEPMGEMMDTIAAARREGVAYAAYLGDFPINVDDVGTRPRSVGSRSRLPVKETKLEFSQR